MRSCILGGFSVFFGCLMVFMLGVQIGFYWGAYETKYQLTPRPIFNDEDKSEMRSILEPAVEGGSHE